MSNLSFGSVLRATVASVVFVVAGTAHSATATTWLLNQFNEPGTTPVGQVGITESGDTLSFSVTLFGNYQFLGGADIFGFVLDGAPTITYSNFGSTSFFGGGDINTATNVAKAITKNGGDNMDGWGRFQYFIDAAGSGGSALNGQTLTFDVTAAGLDLADIIANSQGSLFAAHVCEAGASAASCGSVPTGFAAGGPVLPPGGSGEVPLPGAILLMGTVLAGAGGVAAWRRRRSRAVS